MTIWVFCEIKWGGHSNDDFFTEFHTLHIDYPPTKDDTLKALNVLGVDDFNRFSGSGWHEELIKTGRVFWTKSELMQ